MKEFYRSHVNSGHMMYFLYKSSWWPRLECAQRTMDSYKLEMTLFQDEYRLVKLQNYFYNKIRIYT